MRETYIALCQIQAAIAKLAQLPPDPTNALIIELDKVLRYPPNYSLMFGRVHKTQRSILEAILVPGVVINRRRPIGYWRMYSAMTMTMYVTHQCLLPALDNPRKLLQQQSGFLLWQRQH